MPRNRNRSKPTHVADCLSRVLKQAGLDSTLMQVELVRRWRELVGSQMAQQTWPEILKDGVLVVATAHPAWKHELHYHQREILERVNAMFGREAAKTVSILVRPRPSSEDGVAPTPRPQAEQFGSQMAGAVDDDVLREAIRRAAAANAEARFRGRLG